MFSHRSLVFFIKKTKKNVKKCKKLILKIWYEGGVDPPGGSEYWARPLGEVSTGRTPPTGPSKIFLRRQMVNIF